MINNDNPAARIHEDPDLFREAVNFTSAETGFVSGLIEKDYFCTLLLQCLASTEGMPVFKGGTCLAKVHAGFYCLSEDLDFSIPMAADATRSERSRQATAIKQIVSSLPGTFDIFRLIQPLTGANNSMQYVAIAGYRSLLSIHDETIKIEVGLREPLYDPIITGPVKTILLNPVSGKMMVQPFHLPCISFKEAMAEKFRAALSRREIAIRDFYDIYHALRTLHFDPADDVFVELVRKKLAVPGNDPIDLSDERILFLRQQLASQLKPVLREKDFAGFDLEGALEVVKNIAEKLNE